MALQIIDLVGEIEKSLSELEHIHAAAHERGGREFVWNTTEIGHIHWNGDLDILLSKKARTALVKAGITQIHKWIPESGWTTFPVADATDIATATNLLRLSYFHKRLRKSTTPEEREYYSSQLSSLPFSSEILSTLGALQS